VLSDTFEVSALYDRTIQQVLLAYKAPPSNDIFLRTEVGGAAPFVFYTNGLLNWKTSAFMNRRLTITVLP
jgi:hypothetical protein